MRFVLSVLVFVPSPENAKSIVAWTNVLFEREEVVQYVCLEERGDSATEEALRSVIGLAGSGTGGITSFSAPAPVAELVERCRKLKPRLLVTGFFSLGTINGRVENSEELVRAVPCRAISPLFGKKCPDGVHNIVMIVSRGSHDLTTLRITEKLRQKLGATVTLATIEDESGPKVERAGEKAILSLVHDAGFETDNYEIKVVVDAIRHRGILHCGEGSDLIICGSDNAKHIRPLRESLNETIALIVKRSPPLRMNSLADWLPRINPTDHAELLQDLRQGSRWNADFVSMLALASAIATLGLLQNSPAVVIGSMLLAPMMTPMIGAGLALAQGNVPLARQCAKSILLGFLLTLAVSFIVSFVLFMLGFSRVTLPPEVISRGSPNILDLLIALFAAIAATIAMARPGIAGAVAGVAIATALVPPICALGVSLSSTIGFSLSSVLGISPSSALGISQSKFALGNAIGALLLFSTNLVAIIVASSFTFSVLGIVTGRVVKRNRIRIIWEKWGLVVLLIVLAGPLTVQLSSQVNQGRDQAALYPVTRALSISLGEHVDKYKGVNIVLLGRPSVERSVLIQLSADHPIEQTIAHELRQIVREKMNEPDLPVYVVCLGGQWVSDDKAIAAGD